MKKGFTLIELVVAIGLFGFASVISTGLLLSLINSQSKAIAIRSALDNLGFGMEIMTKEIRTGKNYGAGGSSFSFTNFLEDIVTYSLNANGQLQKSCSPPAPDPNACGGTGGYGSSPITAPEVNIGELNFYVTGVSPLDALQPKVTVVIKALVGGKIDTNINLQATITQRKIDY